MKQGQYCNISPLFALFSLLRLSFLSGHSSFSFYCSFFLVVYLQVTIFLAPPFLFGQMRSSTSCFVKSLEGSMEAEAEAVDDKLKEAEVKKKLTTVASLRQSDHFTVR